MKRVVDVAIVCCFFTAIAFGQVATTSLQGVIKDPSGATLQGASIALTNPSTGASYQASTNISGFYIFPVVIPARYSITVTATNFASQTRTAELLVDQPATINFTLTVKAEHVTVDVSDTTEVLNLTDATMGNAVGNSVVQALPMDERDPISLLTLQPGVVYLGQNSTLGTADSRQGAVAGGRSDQGNITLDGLDNNDQVFGTAFQGILRSTLDSTDEFRVITSNGTAASGRSSGAQVNLVTKSGTNSLHGALYEYYRPTNTVANQFFLKNAQISSGEPNIPQKYIVNVFGGSLGGPILKDKLFFFFNYEGKRQAVDQIVPATVPTASFMQGELQYVDPSGNNHVLTASQVATLDVGCTLNTFNGAAVCPNGPGPNAALLAYYAKVPTATGTLLGDGLNSGSYYFASHNPQTLNTSILKFDYNLSTKHRFFARGNLQKDTIGGAANLPGQKPQSFYDDNTKGISAGYTWLPTPHIVNDLRYGYVRQGYQTGGIGVGEYVYVEGLQQPSAQTRTSYLHVPVNNITDTISWNRGVHTFQIGGNWRGVSNQHGGDTNSFDGAETNPLYACQLCSSTDLSLNLPNPNNVLGGSFATAWEYAYADLMGVIPEVFDVYNYKITSLTSGTALPVGAFVVRDFHANEYEYFLQDTWHVRHNLTVTLGMRHTILQTPYEIHGQQISPTIDMDHWYKERELAALQGQIYEPVVNLAPSGKANGQPAYFPKQKGNIAPRLGVVWAPDANTSIRASAGIYYDHYGESLVNSFDTNGSYGLGAGQANQADILGFENSPRFTAYNAIPDISIGAPPLSTQSFPYAPPLGGFGIDWGIDNHLKTPYAEAVNFSIQRRLPAGMVFEQAYIGRFGRHLIQQLDLAEPVDYVDPQGGGDYFSAARILSAEVDAAPFNPVTGIKTATVAPILYFEHVFPYMAGVDFAGESATQAIFNNVWAPQRYTNGETLALAFLDVFGIFPGSPNYPNFGSGPPSKFWSNQFSSLYALDTIGPSSYNALQFTLRHPTTHGLTFDVGYTFSKSLDIGSEAERANQFQTSLDNAFTNFAIQNTWNPKLNKGPSDYDMRSQVTGDWVYALPLGRGKAFLGSSSRLLDSLVGGWQISGLARVTSGLPFTLESPAYPTNYNNPGFGIAVQPIQTHREIAGGVPRVIDANTASEIGNGIYFGSPIRLPYAGEAGQRNNYRGDGFFEIDSAVSKTWNITERFNVKFAAEGYNISNTQRFDVSPAGLDANTASPLLGVYSGPLAFFPYRRLQFGLRLGF